MLVLTLDNIDQLAREQGAVRKIDTHDHQDQSCC